jgi:hypothetical protein
LPGNAHSRLRDLAFLALTTILAIAIQGYHPGLEDDAFYLAAIKRDLNPALFPHDADFFRLQFQATIFDKLVADSVRMTHLPLGWLALLWQFAATFAILAGCLAIARRVFQSAQGQWAAVLTVAMMLTIPVSGTGISLTDQYLHPRTLATAAILGAVVAVLDRRYVRASIFLAAAVSVHVIMAAFGISICVFLGWKRSDGCLTHPGVESGQTTSATMLLLFASLPLPWLFQPTSPAWREAASTRHFYFITRWPWYEWLGVVAPLFILYVFARVARDRELPTLAHISIRTLYYAVFQMTLALAIMLPPQFERLRPFEPMRYLQLVYLFMFLIIGGLTGQNVLRSYLYRWLLFFAALGAGMFYSQRQMYPSTAHLELPGSNPSNDWLKAFAWIRTNTSTDALFALDPYYMELPGEDFHGFRALAERSALADMIKDPGMVARVPSLAPRWQREVRATNNWQNFQPKNFQSLRDSFGVRWVVLQKPAPGQSSADMVCPYENSSVKVCRIG